MSPDGQENDPATSPRAEPEPHAEPLSPPPVGGDNRVAAESRSGPFVPRKRRRTDRRGYVEFAFSCPVVCHGFGRCQICQDTGTVWRRPRPYEAMW